MERKIWKWVNGGSWVLVSISFVYSAISAYGDISGYSPHEIFTNSIARVIAVTIIILFLGWQAWQYRNKYLDVIDSMPNVRADGFKSEKVQITVTKKWPKKIKKTNPMKGVYVSWGITPVETSSTGSQSMEIEKFLPDSWEKETEKGDIFERFFIVFRNTKLEDKSTQDTSELHARVTFYNKDCSDPHTHECPRWRGTPAPYEPQPKIILRASGKPEQLGLTLRKEGSKEMYIYSEESYDQDNFDPTKVQLQLKDQEYYINILISAGNLREDFSTWVLLVNKGKNNKPEFSFIDRPCNLDDEI